MGCLRMAIKTLVKRVKSMSFKRMNMLISKISKESKVPGFFIFFDMIYCVFKYGVGYLDYRIFGFVYIHGKARKTFMTMDDNIALVRKYNDKDLKDIFNNKIKFNKQFNNYLGRKWLYLKDSSLEDFKDFVSDKKFIFAKRIDDFGGKGIDRIDLAEQKNLKILYDTLISNGQFLVEEPIVQHSKLNQICSTSVNTIRIVTILSGGAANVMYALIRIGDGIKYVDNISSGGLYCPIDENGMISKPAFCDATGEYYEYHPITKTKLVGFEIPYFKQAIELVKKAAFEVPKVCYVGWDVAISENGPVLIEGNSLPSYDMCQNYYHLGDEKIGIRDKFLKVLNQN